METYILHPKMTLSETNVNKLWSSHKDFFTSYETITKTDHEQEDIYFNSEPEQQTRFQQNHLSQRSSLFSFIPVVSPATEFRPDLAKR